MSKAVLDAVRDLLPQFRERADEAERLRVVPESSIKDMESAGFFRLLQPRRFDGLEADPVDFYTAVKMMAGACNAEHVDWFPDGRWACAARTPDPSRGEGVSAAPSSSSTRCVSNKENPAPPYSSGSASPATPICSRSTDQSSSSYPSADRPPAGPRRHRIVWPAARAQWTRALPDPR